MYVKKGCPACESAKEFFTERKILPEVIEIGFDPIIQAGMRAVSGNGQGLSLPVLIPFAMQEIILGNNPVDLQRIADFINCSSASSALAK